MKIEKLNGGYSDSLNIGDIVTPKHKPGAAWTVLHDITENSFRASCSGSILNNESMEFVLTSHSELQALAQLESIREMIAALHKGEPITEGERFCWSDPQDQITEHPLSVEVRSGWYGVSGGSESGKDPAEFRILLCTGGPAVQIVGALSEHCEPESCRLEHQDWGTPWTEYRLSSEDTETLLEYCRCFYFGE